MLIAKAKKRALSTAMMRELRAEYSEAPEEVRDDMNLHRFKQSQEDKHRIAYEEDNFKRIMLTKDEKVCSINLLIPRYVFETKLSQNKSCVLKFAFSVEQTTLTFCSKSQAVLFG